MLYPFVYIADADMTEELGVVNAVRIILHHLIYHLLSHANSVVSDIDF